MEKIKPTDGEVAGSSETLRGKALWKFQSALQGVAVVTILLAVDPATQAEPAHPGGLTVTGGSGRVHCHCDLPRTDRL